jgi:hypothetical protein
VRLEDGGYASKLSTGEYGTAPGGALSLQGKGYAAQLLDEIGTSIGTPYDTHRTAPVDQRAACRLRLKVS